MSNTTQRALALVLLQAALTGCTTVPETGRRQTILLSKEKELKLGQDAWLEAKQTDKLSEDAAASAAVETVGRRIAAASRADYAWEFALFESEQVNAYCLPGGKVGVMTGILPVAENEAGLAAVMGHEVAHAVCRHGAERYSQGQAIRIGGQVISRGAGVAVPGYGGPIDTAYSLGSKVGVALPFSRMHESEADRVGMIYMARAGYDPEEAVRFWERMEQAAEKADKKRPPAWLSTHPREKQRIQKLREYLPEARKFYEAAPEKYGRGQSLPIPSPSQASSQPSES